ncbi:hypothetical protein EV715DRAFT_268165 [Schizophyllum commune]
MDLAVVSKSGGRPAARVEAFLNLSARSPLAVACGRLGRRRVPPWEELACSPSVKILDIPLATAFLLGPRPARALCLLPSRSQWICSSTLSSLPVSDHKSAFLSSSLVRQCTWSASDANANLGYACGKHGLEVDVVAMDRQEVPYSKTHRLGMANTVLLLHNIVPIHIIILISAASLVTKDVNSITRDDDRRAEQVVWVVGGFAGLSRVVGTQWRMLVGDLQLDAT